MEKNEKDFLHGASAAMADKQLQANLGRLMMILRTMHSAGVGSAANFEDLRRCASEVKRHTLEHLDFYLETFEKKVIEKGGKVYYAETCEDLNSIVVEICRRRGARIAVKGKSMVSEETGLNRALEKAGIEVTETDMGEYIVQLAHERPSHLVGPAIHKNKEQIADLFMKHHDLGPRSLDNIPSIVAEGRKVLREKFIKADVGITGANALIAETGSVLLVTNEGNGDLCSTLPKVHIVVSGIEKVVPRLEDAGAILRVLARSITGQAMSCYTSIFTGPREGPEDAGPEEFHVVLLDNHRSEILAGEFRDILRCIRCSSCMNHCPVFGVTGGHAYGSVYVGPMGSVLTPLMEGMREAGDLPDACCGDDRCAEVCPMMIPLPDLLRRLRTRKWNMGIGSRPLKWGLSAYMKTALRPRLFHAASGAAAVLASMLQGGKKRPVFSLNRMHGIKTHLPTPQGKPFFSPLGRKRREL
ncbi:MAG: iron-sulfur cluster-binding protein [Deltaproteobacteria bacterium CG23_combo_of_CG06-09_8_20_14_all_51_20]|nr:iron-sulfur cluster-binding protein [bacterium]NCP07838.1 iron-sulfur cluster-binding protein [bacterium]PIP46171.1 MAG: iron-sulfur cluster-binding protein [Deltaproteobacteria bacterium CG23_combo_of_CG06-09_8_20_14_all_51_20]PJB39256.1 MAG: iron-sulfur cluster-binding protein [Deltaproteobacteria bacterium CG_4_9_14_3_um_filter_51_14]